MTTAVETLKAGHRATWAAGDYAAVAEMIDVVAPEQLVARAGVTADQDVLDVATGTGNVALRAAAAGARVVGLDLTPELFGPARQREAEWNVEIDWVEGDAEALPFEDESFDVVLSAFGVQFAPRHEVVAGELVRVCRTGGIIAVCGWTPQGTIGELFSILGRYMPPAPSFATPPPRWGDEEHVRTLFTNTGDDVELEFERHTTPFDFDSAEHWVGFMETCYGPLLKARERLTTEGTWDECRGSIVEMMDRRNEATDGRLLVPSEYLVAVAHKR
jgi:SAM-dependent methyltransferase